METLPLAQALYQAVAARDLAAARELLDPGVVLHDPGTHSHGGAHRGRDAVLALMASAGSTAAVEVIDVLGGREHAAVYCRVSAAAGGAQLDNASVHLLHIRGGRIDEVWFHNRDQAHVDAFWTAVAS
jgi:ketosteroid isomerase-like protein